MQVQTQSGIAPSGARPLPPGATPDSLAAQALALHRQGLLEEAEPLYRAALAADPRHFQALHLLGLLRATAGDPAGALPFLRRALAEDASHGFVHSNLGNALVELGQAEEGLAAFERAILLEPGLLEARVGWGNALYALGRHAEALNAHDSARALGADMPELHNNRGNALRGLSRPVEALAAYDAAIARRPTYAAAHANRATALADLHREPEALASIAIALMLSPDHPGFLNTQGIILRALARPEEALACFDRAIALAPSLADAHASRTAALCDLGRYEEALASADTALALSDSATAHRNRAATLALLGRHSEAEAADRAALRGDPASGEAWNGRGNALVELGRFEEALDCFRQAEALHPGACSIPYNRGNALRGLGRHEEAVSAFAEALALDPGFADAEWNAALSHLALGRLPEGFAGYEARWRRRAHPERRHAESPLWLGGPVPAGRLLLHAEQGLGDTIQMVRYIPMLAARGARMLLEVQRPLVPLLRSLPGVEAVIPFGEPAPPHDAQCPLMSLPLALGTVLETIPPPIPFPSARAEAWQHVLPAPGRRLGIVCSGNPQHRGDRHRSIPLALFAPLLRPGVQGFLIQTELREADEAFLAGTPGLMDLRPMLTDFTETAAALMAMDAVVCVDTSVAHLAGSLGRPTHLLIPPLPDWRWMLGRADTPWYPSMRLHRRARDEGWEAVIARLPPLPWP
ncbi:glycosyltransferase family protein [Roseomonas sp. SSH11]|uniref:Glycosyltransferase family protein n=1 Tax=Pararoseomonas baculiformis TaxID=2820812 RepID=A0ABS4A9M8_9PROT|nr:tetratricopeptide repeat protein [Pararoseomonas baculiformis]MBP0443706.1 glycosyltransferase family protein [Pararoseomonas baculiformis]